MKKIILSILMVLLIFTTSFAGQKSYKIDLENAMDKVNDLLFSCEAGLSQNELVELNRKMVVELKKFIEKHPNTIASHNFTNINNFMSNINERLYWINQLSNNRKYFSGYLTDICNEINLNKEGIKNNKKVTSKNIDTINKNDSNNLSSEDKKVEVEAKTEKGKELIKKFKNKK